MSTASLGPLPGGRPVDAALWGRLNRAIIAKTISELAFEEALHPEPTNGAETQWLLRLDDGVAYRFRAERRIWGNLSIAPESLMRQEGGVIAPAVDAGLFMVDAAGVLNVAPDTLCIYVKELANTLLADARIAALNEPIDGAALAALPDRVLQQHLDGHPKAPASKGRIGWGLKDAEDFAPEFQRGTVLFWVAADRSACRLTLDPDIDEDALLAASLDAGERTRLDGVLAGKGVDRARFLLMPVHPWQWDHMVAAQFAGEIAAGRLVPLGTFGAPYLPQQSLRTLAHADDPKAMQVKLSLTILNTSAWRGVPGKYMGVGPAFSRWLAQTAARDPELRNTVVLREPAGAFYPHPLHERIAGAPYQFREMLGAIWRESPEAKLPEGKRPMMMGALLKQDRDGRCLAATLMAQSGLSIEDWLERLFQSVAVPLYHFLCAYGVGFIAHGQNVTLVLDGSVPCGVILKDLQGDADLVDLTFPEAASLPREVRETLLKRPAGHLLQHIQTGHVTSVLRFLSDALARDAGLAEIDFYAILARVLRRHQARHPDLAERFALFDLFAREVPRIAINKVRLAVGYADAGQRPVPSLGTPLLNPLHLAEAAMRDAQARVVSASPQGAMA